MVGAKLILRFERARFAAVFAVTAALVLTGILVEHSGLYVVMAAGGFLAALGDDALQVRANALLQDMLPSEQRATLISVNSLSFSLIMIVLSPFAGWFFTVW